MYYNGLVCKTDFRGNQFIVIVNGDRVIVDGSVVVQPQLDIGMTYGNRF